MGGLSGENYSERVSSRIRTIRKATNNIVFLRISNPCSAFTEL